jgi:hypothetical protein
MRYTCNPAGMCPWRDIPFGMPGRSYFNDTGHIQLKLCDHVHVENIILFSFPYNFGYTLKIVTDSPLCQSQLYAGTMFAWGDTSRKHKRETQPCLKYQRKQKREPASKI